MTSAEGSPSLARRDLLLAAAVAGVSLLPFVRGLCSGQSFFFRDLASHFFPLRRLAADGLRAGELHYWNPWDHEGIPTAFPPVSYPPDLLHAAWPSEAFFTLLLALHVPLGAVLFAWLARAVGADRAGALAGAVVFALGGFALSMLNFYVYAQALAWSPLLVLVLMRVGAAGAAPRAVAVAAVVCAVALSTAGVELVGQACLIGLVLGWRREAAVAGPVRAGASLLLGAALAAPTLLVMSHVASLGARADGFDTSVTLAHSIHPFTWLQVVVGDLYGDLGRLTDRFWGSNFFPRGFPYVLSLYLGATCLTLAAAAGLRGRGRLLALLAGAVVLATGRWAGLEGVVDLLPVVRRFRFPTKLFFTVHFVTALLVAHGVSGLARASDDLRWRRIRWTGLAVGSLLLALSAVPLAAPAAADAFMQRFLPPGFPIAMRAVVLRDMLGDAAVGGGAALLAATCAALVAGRRVGPRAGILLVVGVLAADLLRTGAGLNPMVSARFWELEPAMQAMVPTLREGRIHSCDVQASAAYWSGRRSRPSDHEAWTFSLSRNVLQPETNGNVRVRAAAGEDMTGLVPSWMVDESLSCSDPGPLLPRLREAGVRHLVSLDALDHADLSLAAVVQGPSLAPASVHVYRLAASAPRAEMDAGGRARVEEDEPGRIRLTVHSPAGGTLLVREGWAPGWAASLGGRDIPVERARGRYLGVRVPAGDVEIQFTYRPPGLRAGLAVAAASGLGVALLLVRRSRS